MQHTYGWTGGTLSIVEHPFPVGALVPPHLHTREDEYSIVTEGEIGFRFGDREVVLGSGGYITKPRGELHTMWNAGSEPARMIKVISPAGFEGFLPRAGRHGRRRAAAVRRDVGAERPVRPSVRPAGLAARADPRYGLTPPPGA
jgi:mannose-6-phosphate isomerase-like protein (cupin superfamily)